MNNEPISDLEGIVAEHRSLAVLRALYQLDGSANEHVLLDRLERLALGGTRRTIRDCLDQLDMKGLLRTTWAGSTQVVHLTERGRDVTTGREVVEGVLKAGADGPY
ncbi:VpaChn25_0724 family phage protein [Ancylobacter moscoviensis]